MNMPINTANLKNNLTALAKNWVKKLPVGKKQYRFEYVCGFNDDRVHDIRENSAQGMAVIDTQDPDKQMYYVDNNFDGHFKYEGTHYYGLGSRKIIKLKNFTPEMGKAKRWTWKDLQPHLDGKPDHSIDDAIRVEYRFMPIEVEKRFYQKAPANHKASLG